jgi:hypothetical protein
LHHRCCIDCWFEKNDKGQRKYESDITKNIPLVENPFKNNDPKCIGCWKGLKFYINDIENISKYETIIINYFFCMYYYIYGKKWNYLENIHIFYQKILKTK